MKKYIGSLLLLFVSVLSFAVGSNDFVFVTTLSSPQGVYSRLEATSVQPVSVSEDKLRFLNYCTASGVNNQITVLHAAGSNDAEFGTFVLNTANSKLVLEKDVSALTSFAGATASLSKDAKVTVGRLLAQTVTIDTPFTTDLNVADTLYVSAVTAKVAKIDEIHVKQEDGSYKKWFPVCYSDGTTTAPCEDTGTKGLAGIGGTLWKSTYLADKSGVDSCTIDGVEAKDSSLVLVKEDSTTRLDDM